MGEVNRVRNGNREPLSLRLDSYWFEYTKTSFEGFSLFLDKIKELDDVFLVSNQDVIEWFKNPVPVSQYQTPRKSRVAPCNPITCQFYVSFLESDRYMRSCVPCPSNYPWKGNPLGQ